MSHTRHTLLLLIVCLAVPGSARAAAPADSHDRLVAEYLDGRWDEAEADLAALPKDPPGAKKTPEQADIDYVRRTIGECRPPWWKATKAGKRTSFRVNVWGQTQGATFDPAAKTSIQLNYLNGTPSLTFKWDTADMDNPAEAEHGFSKGELSDLGIWQIVGTGVSWSAIPVRSQINLKEDEQRLLSRYLDFRGNVTGIYYGTPRARRWGLWLDLAAWMEKYAKMTTVNSRKAVGAMFMEEVLAHPQTYPSIKLPEALPEEGAEAKLAEHLKGWIGKHPMTLAEDQAFRDAVKAFAGANTLNVRSSGVVKLRSGLPVALDPELDKPNAAAREEHIREQLKTRNTGR